jgi:hypothetical protein
MGKKKGGDSAVAGGDDDLDAILAELNAAQTILCTEEVCI